MAVNFRASEILLAPSASGGVTVRQTPPSDGLRLENRLRLDTRRCGNYRGRVRERWSEESINGGDAARAVLTLSGSYSRRCGERGWRLAAPLSHPRYVAGVFAAMWRRLGGEFGGEWRVGKTPPNAPHIAEFESPPLADILRGMNKFSNNFMARQIFLSLPAAAGGEPPHTIAAARAAVHSWLQTRKLIADGKSASDSESFFIDNGSGLSRRARMTPDLMAAALANAWAHPWRAEFLASLPLAGLDGTMKKRFRNGDLAGRARFKTGSLNNVKALAGVVRDAAGRDWIVVCFVNWRGAWKAKRFQDNFLRWLFQNGAALGGV
jgi:D-alanyl-D-alanine carboxypeptidase/D-alanyl-D-alanine-endopeptidase (penicillin-binding protein 4)